MAARRVPALPVEGMNALILDTETTGLTDPRPVEIAWLRIGLDLVSVEAFCQRYDPDKAIEYGAMATHHILPAELVGQPLWNTFRLPPGVEYLIGHNVDYDWAVIGSPDIKRICTLALARRLWPTVDSHTQGALLYFFQPRSATEKLRGAHSAMADAWACHAILAAILRQLGPLPDWEAVWRISEAARIPTHMPFGKHKGLELAKVPADYKRWLLGQPDVDPYLRKALEGKHTGPSSSLSPAAERAIAEASYRREGESR